MLTRDLSVRTVGGEEFRVANPPPAWGPRRPGAGRAVHVAAGMEYQATTAQACGLYPFTAGSGSPMLGVPIGRHQLWGEVVCLDPLEWLTAGLVTNPGIFVLGQPGVGKSTIVKRLVTGMTACGTQTLIIGDTKPDYTPLVEFLGGQVIKAGRGMDRINPLDSGPLAAARSRMSGQAADKLRLEIRGRRMSLLLALCTLVRREPLSNNEEVILGRAVDLLTDRLDRDPTVPDVLRLVEEGPDELVAAARAHDHTRYLQRVDQLVASLALLCEGSLAGAFDGATTSPIDLDAPAISVDISRVQAAGDTLLSAAMLCTWAFGFGAVDAAAVLAEQNLAPRRRWLGVMDELWRALRGASGLVDHADALTRLNRARGMGTIMVTHGLADLDALPTAEDVAKAHGFMERCAIKVFGAVPSSELDRISQVVRLTGPERDLVAGWAAPEGYATNGVHPGRGKYLVKNGERVGLPVSLHLVPDEVVLYDTDAAVRQPDHQVVTRR
jgi:hypothetical protein